MKNTFANKSIPFLIALAMIILLVLIATSCTTKVETKTKLEVMVTIPPQAEFVEKTGGDKVNVTVMIPPGASPHTYEPKPQQMTVLSSAQMYAKVGSGVEFERVWMDKLIAQNKDMLVVDCSHGVQLQTMEATNAHENEDGDHDRGAMDPHIWMSPRNAQIMVQNIANGLIQVDPDNRDYYEHNRDAYLQQLEQIDQDICEALSRIENRAFMVYHPAFGYFASSYNLVMLSIETGGDEPTPAKLQQLIEQAKEYNIRAVFIEPQFNPQSARVIANAIDGELITIDSLARDYTDNLHAITEKLARAME
jgi:zinc transport system substrate-binding protein